MVNPSSSQSNASFEPAAEPVDADDILTLRTLLNSKEAGVIIGKQGKTIADMRDATACKAGVSKVVGGVQERILSVTGLTEKVAKFYSLVAAALLENPIPTSAPSMPTAAVPTSTVVRLLISHGHMGGIIGKQGAKIKYIQDASGARMTASKDMLANSTERVVEISGSAEAIRQAIVEVAQCILADVDKGLGTILFQPGAASPEAVSPSAYLPSTISSAMGGPPMGTPARRLSKGGFLGNQSSPATPSPVGVRTSANRRSSRTATPTAATSFPPTTPAAAVAPNGETFAPSPSAPTDPSLRTQNISIPSDMVGCIIGRGGQKINEIRRLSGSRINIAKVAHDETGERLFSIVGLPEANEKALYLLYSSLEAEKERRTREGAAQSTPIAEVGA